MARLTCSIVLALAALGFTSVADVRAVHAETPDAALVKQLSGGDDFRIRVKAALELGKLGGARARAALERALRDANPAVRAAAAAGLKVLGDPASIAALERHAADESAPVSAQVRAALVALRRKAEQAKDAKVVVRLGDISAGEAKPAAAPVLRDLAAESRKRLGTLPGVVVVSDSDAETKKSRVPVVMVTGRLKSEAEARDESGVTYSAKVEYVVHTLPSKAIVGLVSGSASARASALEAKSAQRMAQFRREVLAAAVDSALRRAPAALEAAAR
jgi:hypothetical protein